MSFKAVPNSSRTNQANKASSLSSPKVLHLVSSLALSAEARETVDFAIQINRAGWKSVMASSGGSLVMEVERAAIRHTRAPLHKDGLWARCRSRATIETLFQKERPSIVHAHGFDTLNTALGLMTTRHVPALIDLTEPGKVTGRTKKTLDKLANRGARFRVPSVYMARHLREDFHLHTDALYVAHSGIDMQWFDAVRVTPERANKLSQLWRLPESATIILMSMPLAPGYGHRDVLEALASLKQDDVVIVMVGSDEGSGMRGRIEALVSRLHLQSQVIMPENCEDWPAACWLASAVVAPNSAPRGQGMVLLSAQAIGRPVIVTSVGANEEMVCKGETAWVVEPQDKQALAEALNEAVNLTSAEGIDLAVRTRDFIKDNFPQQTWVQEILDIYHAMMTDPLCVSGGKA